MDFQQKMKFRTKNIGLEVINLVDCLPQKPAAWVLSKQIIKSSTSIGANYRAACRAKSTADFINKLKIVEEETDETLYWLEILENTQLVPAESVKKLTSEISEVLAIVVAAIKTTRSRNSSLTHS